MNHRDITAILNSSSSTDASSAAASLRYLVTCGFWSHISHSSPLPPAVALALASSSRPLLPVAALSDLSSSVPTFVHLSAIDDPPSFPPFARFQQNAQGERTASRLSVTRMWSQLVADSAAAASTSLRRSAAVYFPASAHAIAREKVELLLLRRCSPAFGDMQEAVAFGRGACAQWGCSFGLQLDTSAWTGGAAGELPENLISRHVWMGHVGGMRALYVQDVEELSVSSRAQLQKYGRFMSQLPQRDVPDATCALLLPFDHAYTPYAEAAGSSNSMWHPQPPASVISSIMDMFFPGVASAAQWQRSWGHAARPMADTQWGSVLDVLVDADGDAVRRVSNDAWAKYKVVIVPSFPQQQQPLQLDDIVSAAAAGATVVLDAGIALVLGVDHQRPLLLAASGCDFGRSGTDVLVRAWVRSGLRGQAPSAATNEIFMTRPCIVPPAAPKDGSRVEVLAHSAGAGMGKEIPLVVRKWHGGNGGSVITCTVPYMQAPTGMAGPCKEAVKLAGAAASVVSVRSSGSGAGLLLAYSSSSSSDGSMRRVVLNNNAASWWVGDVRVAPLEKGRAWHECQQHEGSDSQLAQQQLDFETGIDGEACLQAVRVPPYGFLLISCAHVPQPNLRN
jgi:hypothetical protein